MLVLSAASVKCEEEFAFSPKNVNFLANETAAKSIGSAEQRLQTAQASAAAIKGANGAPAAGGKGEQTIKDVATVRAVQKKPASVTPGHERKTSPLGASSLETTGAINEIPKSNTSPPKQAAKATVLNKGTTEPSGSTATALPTATKGVVTEPALNAPKDAAQKAPLAKQAPENISTTAGKDSTPENPPVKEAVKKEPADTTANNSAEKNTVTEASPNEIAKPPTKDGTAPEAPGKKDSVATKAETETGAPPAAPSPEQPDDSAPPADSAKSEGPHLRLITEVTNPDSTVPPVYRKVQLRLSGSMCYACLNTLKKKLKQVYGVEKVRIEKPMANLFQPYAPDVSSWAEGVMVYDQARVGLNELRSYMRSNGYVSYKVVDKNLDEPLEAFKEGKF